MIQTFLLRAGAAFFVGVALLPLPDLRAQSTASSVPEHTNRLIHEKSPYLLQHAHNPVDWYPWGEEAFAKARKENKPIFLSVGYSTCHWCHVMERESFENPAIAKLMNDSFVSIKVDREERPDVDATYMTFIQATTGGGGGWPMTVFLTPELKPFTGGTYFPAEDSGGQPGLKTILPKITDAWHQHGPEIVKQADQILPKLREFTTTPASQPGNVAPGSALLDAGYQQLAGRFDAVHGGFGDAPKFPQPVTLDLLTRVYARHGADSPEGKRALEMDLATLRHMAAGGIHDHLGGGFHRYSTDARWHVPHFEKMLYDQAQLAIAYLEAYQITGDEQFADTARDILAYVQRDLTDPATGGFLSAEDADSQPRANSPERVEGAFYVWTQADLDRVLGPDDAPLFDWYYGVEKDGNVPAQSDARGELRGQNVLDATGRTPDEAAAKFKRPVEQVNASLARQPRQTPRRPREAAPGPGATTRSSRPGTAWLSPRSPAPTWCSAIPPTSTPPRKAAGFLQASLYDAKTGQLTRSYRQGASATAGFADDYAFLIRGLFDLYEADFQPDHLRWAETLQKTQDALFWDAKGGGYFNTAGTIRISSCAAKPTTTARSPAPAAWPRSTSPASDRRSKTKATPSGPPACCKLSTPRSSARRSRCRRCSWRSTSRSVRRARSSSPGRATRQTLPRCSKRRANPSCPTASSCSPTAEPAKSSSPRTWIFFKDLHPLADKKATAYVCENFTCHLPTSDLAAMQKLLAATPTAK